MLLRNEGQYNELSLKLREEVRKKVEGFGKVVRYKFDISNENPDPQKHDGKLIWPNMYTLDPATFYITDPNDKKSKRIGLVDTVEFENGHPIVKRFKKIKVDGKYKGILKLEIAEIEEHFDFAMYLELHPKVSNGMFPDKTKRQMITRVDEQVLAKEQREVRTSKLKALNAAQSMSDKELVDFADAMMWDSTQDIELLKNQVEELAETNPVYFNDKVVGKTIEYLALVKRALDKSVILFDPAEYKFSYAGNNQTITMLSPAGDKSEVEKFAEWLQVGGEKADEVYKKIKSLIK